MRALVTGGAGFIGSHLVEKLLSYGWDVAVVDDLSTGREANLSAVRGRITFLKADILDEGKLSEAMRGCDVVFHLAAAVGVGQTLKNPVHTLEVNLFGTMKVLKVALDLGVKVVFTSSSEVYGRSSNVPLKETDFVTMGPTYRPRWGYGYSKAMGELLCLAYNRDHGLPVVILRLFNTIGPRQSGRYGMVVPKFVEQALTGRPITVYGDGRQTRCFAYVGDVVDALAKVGCSEEAVGGVFNLGNDEEVSINFLARTVRKLCGSDSPIVHIPEEKLYDGMFDDIPRRVPDISRINMLIGYEPRTSLEDSITEVIEYRRFYG